MYKIIKKHESKLKFKIYNFVRQAYLKRLICNIGRIDEDEEKILCYVDQKKLEKYKGHNPVYQIHLYGTEMFLAANNKTVEYYGLNKPVYYIFENIVFKSAIKLTTFCSNVIFKKCTFNKNIGIISGDEITFDDNIYSDECPVYFYGKCFLTADNVKKITFINDSFINNYNSMCSLETIFGMKIDAEIVRIIFSNLKPRLANIEIKAKTLSIINSNIDASEIYIDSDKIDCHNSSIEAENGIIIDNKNCDFVGEVKSPTSIYNGVDLSTNKQNISCVSEKERELKEQRTKLVEVLQKMNIRCQQSNESRFELIKKEFDNKPIIKILKKDDYKN